MLRIAAGAQPGLPPVDGAYRQDIFQPAHKDGETARAIAGSRDADINYCDELMEMSFGRFEGRTHSEVVELFPGWKPEIFDFTLAGGESLENLVDRMRRFIDMLSAEQCRDSNILVVCHTGCLRVFLCLLLDIDVSMWWRFRVDLASLTVIDYFPQSPVLSLLNDTSHLNV
jgi:broad specificity phosphatase PhoE